MDDRLIVPVSQMRYDVTFPLFEGRVPVEGVRLDAVKTSSMVTSDVPALRLGEFGLWDLNVGYWLAAIEAGWDLVALPVFPKRKSVLSLIFCRAGAGIRTPQDLNGRRVGTRQHRTAVTLWACGLLKDHYGLEPRSIRWVSQVRNAFPSHDPALAMEYVPASPSMADRLLAGEIDALITDISDGALFDRLEVAPEVARLFPDYQSADFGIYEQTGIYPPMHVIAMSARLARAHPGLALRLYEAFAAAKDLAYGDIAGDRAGFSVVYLREHFKTQQRRWGDPLRYGVRENRAMIDALVRYSVEHGAIRAPLPYERIFAPETLAT